jgi:hypothetical protein
MPHEEAWIVFTLGIARKYIEFVCGEPPPGNKLEVMWHEHGLGTTRRLGCGQTTRQIRSTSTHASELLRSLTMQSNGMSCVLTLGKWHSKRRTTKVSETKPNPAIERTATGKPVSVAHVKYYATGRQEITRIEH